MAAHAKSRKLGCQHCWPLVNNNALRRNILTDIPFGSSLAEQAIAMAELAKAFGQW